MNVHGAKMAHAPDVEAMRGGLQVFALALLASILAGLTGLALVFGRGWLDLPGVAVVVLVYALVPGIPSLLGIRRLLRRSRAGQWRDLANYVSLSAAAAVLWFLPFLGLFIPADRTHPAAVSEMAFYHAVSGAVGGLAFWLLTRRGRDVVEAA